MFLQKHWIWASVSLVVGILIGWKLNIEVLCSGLLVFGTVLLTLLGKRLNHFLIAGIFISIGTLLYSLHPYPLQGDGIFEYLLELKPNSYIDVEGIVIGSTLPDKDNHAIIVLAVSKIREPGREWKQLTGNMQVYITDYHSPIYTHEKVRIRGRSSLYLSPVNFCISCYEDYLRAHRIYSRMITRGSNIQTFGRWVFSPLYWASKLQYSIYKSLVSVAPDNTLGLTKALWLGDRGDLTAEEKDFFTLSGTAHILAISGLHMGMIFFIAKAILESIIKEKKAINSVIALSICLLYALITGLHGSSLRAFGMLFVGTLYFLSERKLDIYSTLAIAVITILLFNPDYLWDIGTQMSVCSVLSILLFYKPIERIFAGISVPWLFARYLALTLSCQVLLILYLSIILAKINILVTLSNLLVIPIVGIFLMISLICFPLLFFPPMLKMFLNILSFFIFIVESICKWFANQDWAILNIPSISTLAIPFFIFTIFLLYKFLTFPTHKNFVSLLISTFVLVVIWKGLQSPNEIEINILDVSHGDTILISTRNNEHILIDGGKREMGKRVVAPFLRAKGIRTLDAVICTHADEDHIGGLSEILKNFKVKQLFYGEGFCNEKNGIELLVLAQKLHIDGRKVKTGDTITLSDGARLKILYCGDMLSEDTNSNSIVSEFIYENFSILLTGDFPADKAKSCLYSDFSGALILKLPHHGLKNSVNEEFLNIVNPKLAVSSGNEFYNGWGVRREVKQILIDRKIPLLRTDMLGGILIKTDGTKVSIEGAREKRGYKILREGV